MWVACHMGGNMVEYGSVFWGVYALIKHDGGKKKQQTTTKTKMKGTQVEQCHRSSVTTTDLRHKLDSNYG